LPLTFRNIWFIQLKFSSCLTRSKLCLQYKYHLKSVVFWDVEPCGFNINRRFGGTCCIQLQGRRNNANKSVNSLTLFLARVISSALEMQETRSSETSVYIKHTRCHIPEDDILHSHRRENLSSYKYQPVNTISGAGRKRSSPRHSPCIHRDGLRHTSKNLGQNCSRRPGQDSNKAPSEYCLDQRVSTDVSRRVCRCAGRVWGRSVKKMQETNRGIKNLGKFCKYSTICIKSQ
jgi:hypothetical protein